MARKKELSAGYRETKSGAVEHRFRVNGKQYSVTGANENECNRKKVQKLLEIEKEREEHRDSQKAGCRM